MDKGMESIRIIICMLGGFLFFCEWYMLYSDHTAKWMMNEKNNLWNTIVAISFTLSIVGLLLGYSLYSEWDVLTIVGLVVNGFIVTGMVLSKLLFKNKKKEISEKIYVKAGTYTISSEEPKGISRNDIFMQVKTNKKNLSIAMNGEIPKKDKDLILECIKTEEGHYMCDTYIYSNTKKKGLKGIIEILFSLYILITMTYGYILASTNYLKSIPDERCLQFLAIPFGYVIFDFSYKSTKGRGDAFSRFWHVISFLFYILLTFEVLIIWFI